MFKSGATNGKVRFGITAWQLTRASTPLNCDVQVPLFVETALSLGI